MGSDNTELHQGYCSCRVACGDATGDGLERLVDLVAYGFDQPTASLMLWVWPRSRVAKEVGRQNRRGKSPRTRR